MVLGVLTVPEPAVAATFTYPGPGCGSTLQACINGAPAGSMIRVAAASVDEKITISKSLTLTKASGASPVIGGTTPRDFRVRSPQDKTIKVVISDLSIMNMNMYVDLNGGRGHSFKFMNSALEGRDDSSNGSTGLGIYATDTNINVEIASSTITADGTPLDMTASATFGTSNFHVHGNDISALDGLNSSQGIGMNASGNGAVNARLHSNVVHDVASCGCGSPGAIRVRVDGSNDANVSVANNTVDDSLADGIRFTTSASTETVRADFMVFNNTVTDTDNGLSAPSYHPDITFLNGYNNFHFNADPPEFSDYGEGPGTMSVDPLFVDEANENYRLQSSSPLRNVGRYLIPGGTSQKDAANKARVSENQVDVGAYETSSRKKCTIIGTSNNDLLQGTPTSDVICGDGGNDRIFGRGGNDRILGGGDEDVLVGNSGSDTLLGGDAADKLDSRDGVKGNDKMSGQAGPDGCKGDPKDTKKSC